MLHSIRGTATPALAGLKYAKNAKGVPLSIRKWVREGRGVLFLPSGPTRLRRSEI